MTPTNGEAEQLSDTARKMLDLRELVFKRWEELVRIALPEADCLRRPLLIDTLPVFYDEMVQQVSSHRERPYQLGERTTATEHGYERAQLTTYNYEALVREYQELRVAVSEVLRQHGVTLTFAETATLHAILDTGIAQAVSAFAKAHEGMREQLAAALTHDLRTPLSIAFTALELILVINDPVKIKTMTAKSLQSLKRMDTMIRELLDTMVFQSGRHLSLDLSHFDICELVKEIRVDKSLVHGPRFHFSGQSVHGWWDHSAIKRAIENIINNAVKYGAPNKQISISWGNDDSHVTVLIHNEGTPIPPDQHACIFQLYRRAKATGGQVDGWGIGLPYVQAVATSHGGGVTVESAEEIGTTFRLELPLDCRPFAHTNGEASHRSDHS